jgi:(p)ppGpp synthase/HD superfamily hydrolase
MAIECGIRDVEYIILLLLHDSVEETKKHRKPFTVEDVERSFGVHTACRISWLTKHDHSTQGILYYWRTLHACKDHRTITTKVIDRIDNIETLHHIKSKERREKKIT